MANNVFHSVPPHKMLWKASKVMNVQEETGALEIQ